MTFKNDDQVLIDALRRFKQQPGFYLQPVTLSENGFVLGEIVKFKNQKELSNVVWEKPGTEMFLAVLEDENGTRLTYKGKTFTTTYTHVDTQPKVDYLKMLGSKSDTPFDYENLDLELYKLQSQRKNAS
jgi:hypothetical protein